MPKKKEKMTIDKLARMSQQEFTAIRKEIATKEDLRATRKEMNENFERVYEGLNRIDETLKVNTIARIEYLEARIERIEKKIGISK